MTDEELKAIGEKLNDSIADVSVLKKLGDETEWAKNRDKILSLPPEDRRLYPCVMTVIVERHLSCTPIDVFTGKADHAKEIIQQAKELYDDLILSPNYRLIRHSPKGADNLLSMGRAKDTSTSTYWVLEGPKGTLSRTTKDYACFPRNFPVNSMLVYLWVTEKYSWNDYQKTDAGNYRIELSVQEWAEKRNKPCTTKKQKANLKAELRQAIDQFDGTRMVYAGDDAKKRRQIMIGVDEYRDGRFDFYLSGEIAEELKRNASFLLSQTIYKIDSRIWLALPMAFKLNHHYMMDANVKAKRNHKLSVGAIYEYCGMPTEKEIKAERKSWKEKALTPFNKALKHLESIGFISDLKYDFSQAKTFEDWQNIMISFSMPDAPTQAKRIREKDERIALAIKKKEEREERIAIAVATKMAEKSKVPPSEVQSTPF